MTGVIVFIAALHGLAGNVGHVARLPQCRLRLNERHSNLSGKPTQRIATNEWPNAYAWVLSICLKFPWGEPGRSAQNLFQRVAAAVFAFSPRRPASTAVRSDCYASMEGILNICWALRFAFLNAFRVLVLVILQSASQFGSPSRRSMRICFASRYDSLVRALAVSSINI